MGKKHSSMGLWDMKTMFHCSIVIFFLGGIATLSYYRNNSQQVVSGKVKVTLITSTTITTTNAAAGTDKDTDIGASTLVVTGTDTSTKMDANTNKGTQVFDHQRSLKIAPPPLTETCDLFSGRWVHDNKSHYPLYKEEECPYLHGDFACLTYGRKDSKYQQWRWQPHGCDFPRFDGKSIVERLKGKRLLFVGDSVNRNQWDSMVCMLHSSIPGVKKVNMGALNRTLYTFRAKEYNISIDYYWAPMLVESNGDDPSNHRLDHRTIRIKNIEKHARHWVGVDFIVFNTYLWWRLPIIKFLKSPGSLLGGPNQVYDEVNNVRAYKMVLATWSKWVQTHIDPAKTKMFFMGLTATHSKYPTIGVKFESPKMWRLCVGSTPSRTVLLENIIFMKNDRVTRSKVKKAENWGGKKLGTCYKETEPVMKDEFWDSGTDPKMLKVLDSSLNKLKAKGVNVQLINITQLTQNRKDAHPTMHRRLWRALTDEQKKNPERSSDCTHWCLPGVPDIWNELLFAYIFPTTKTANM